MRKFVVILIVIGVFLFLATCAVLLLERSNGDADSEWSPVWSSNQQYIAFECMFTKLSDLPDYDFGSHFELRDICIFNRGNNELTRLTTERGMSAPAWSPNGAMLAWLKGNNTIVVWSMSTNQIEYFKSERPFRYSDGRLKWSQDGQSIFMQGDGAILSVQQKVFVDQLPLNRGLDTCCFTWSPDAKYLAYKKVISQDAQGNHWQVVIMKNDQMVFTSDLETHLDDPLHWSPDGSMLAWVTLIASNTEATRYQFALTDAVTRQTEFLTFGNGFIGITGITWSPSGQQVAIRQGDHLQIVNLRSIVPSGAGMTIEKESITLQGSSFEGISWSPDEKFIAYETDWQESSQIWILEPSSNSQTPLVPRFGD